MKGGNVFHFFKVFSNCYADGVVALTATVALVFSIITWFNWKDEFSVKYRPYLTPVVNIAKEKVSGAYQLSVMPRNVGPHPFYFKLSDIQLMVGDEGPFTTSDPLLNQWILLGQNADLQVLSGYISKLGFERIRHNKYKNNVIELRFLLSAKSVTGRYQQSTKYAFSINLLGDKPVAYLKEQTDTLNKADLETGCCSCKGE